MINNHILYQKEKSASADILMYNKFRAYYSTPNVGDCKQIPSPLRRLAMACSFLS